MYLMQCTYRMSFVQRAKLYYLNPPSDDEIPKRKWKDSLCQSQSNDNKIVER